ncbi:hypothetical protein [Ornithinimicrobium panacihumi]|uniref:hypothetical protein n=1 Tax=Ornithinimicrobium panacihumi TaxID=2008449 RepID=UPI003F896801
MRELRATLDGLVRRAVPVRGIAPGPVTGVARLRFGDGTTLLVVSAMGPQVARVVRALYQQHPVTLSDVEESPEGTLLTLEGVPGRRPAQLWLLGPDQPD